MDEPRPLDRFDLTGRVAVVTGAGSGIGRASAALLATAGAIVVCADLDGPGAAATAAAITGGGGGASSAPLDVADRAAVESLVADTVATHGRLDVMANIAGIVGWSPVLEMTDDHVDRLLAVNFKGVLHGCQAAGRIMVEQGHGAIVNMSSASVDTPGRGLGAYAISKTAVAQLTRVLALEVAGRGVRANAVLPGWVLTGMTEGRWTGDDGEVDESLRETILAEGRSSNPLGRLGQPDDIAHAVLYLASDASSFVTGQLLRPNGGSGMPW